MELLKTDNITVAYGSVIALENCSFSLCRGEYVCVVGHNGSGKSTLLSAALGLVAPRSGTVTLSLPREKVAYMPQYDAIPRDFPATAGEIALSGTQKAGALRYTKRDREAARAAMERMGVAGLARRRIGELSGGQRQRVLLARAICRGPELLILDEPAAGLDEASAAELYGLLAALHRGGAAILMATHGLHGLSGLPIRVVEMDKRVVFDGDCDGFISRG